MRNNYYKESITIKYRCGCVETRLETKDPVYRNNIRQGALGRNCPTCTDKLGGRETVLIDGHPFDLPAISRGTDKQLLFAVKIRKRIVAEIRRNNLPADNIMRKLSWKTDSAWWINHKNATAADIAQEVTAAA